jgi:FkbM family methyltransferase
MKKLGTTLWNEFGLTWRVPHWRECWQLGRLCKNWKEVIGARRHRTPLEQFHLRSGVLLSFPPPPPFWQLLDIWGRASYLREPSPAGAELHVIVDVGANIGAFSLFAASRWPHARLLAYEPVPENLVWLKQNVRANRCDQIKVFPVALAGAAGEVSLFLRPGSEAHSLWGEAGETRLSVQAMTLDDVVHEVAPDAIDLLKMDCEGAEYDILAGREDVLSHHVRFLAMEYHEGNGHDVRELVQVLQGAGFEFRVRPQPQVKRGMLYARNVKRTIASGRQDAVAPACGGAGR